MKYNHEITFITFMALFIVCIVGLGCNDGKAEKAVTYSTPSGIPTIWKVTIDGHDYLGFDVYEGGGGLCHAESCQCKKL